MGLFRKWPRHVWGYAVIIALPVFAVSNCIHSTAPGVVALSLNTPEVNDMASRMEGTVRFLSVDCFPRNRQDNLTKAAARIERELKSCTSKVERQHFTVGNRDYENISALFPGKSEERIVIGAHYDACGMTPGADDNASGVAGLLELGRLLKGCSPEYTIELIAYTNEEPPYFGSGDMGSARHVLLLKEKRVKVRSMICLEMIGYFSDEKGSQDYPNTGLKYLLPTTGNFIGIVGNTNSILLAKTIQEKMKEYIPVSRVNMPAVDGLGLDFSDHRNFWVADIPAVMITDTAFFRNKHYHEAGDTPETLDYKRMAACVSGLYEAVVECSGITQLRKQ